MQLDSDVTRMRGLILETMWDVVYVLHQYCNVGVWLTSCMVKPVWPACFCYHQVL